tara:strand:- start:1878 stop:2132 length:255 start_codon:yes stop_codon:yes gene_type:complete
VKFLLRLLFLSILVSLSIGFYHKNFLESGLDGEKIIGATVLFSVIFFLPLFLYNRWKDKNIRDYTLTKENFERMKNIKKKKKVQ